MSDTLRPEADEELRTDWHRLIPKRGNLVLLILAAASVLALAFGQPRLHPDALVTRYLSEAASIKAATTFLGQNGIDVTRYEPSVSRNRSTDLLRVLQRSAGRRALMSADRDELLSTLPVHYLMVTFAATAGDASDDASDDAGSYSVWLTPSGRPWQFTYTEPDEGAGEAAVAVAGVDRAALAALASSGKAPIDPDDDLEAYPDSVITRAIIFRPRIAYGSSDSLGASPAPVPPVRLSGRGRPIVLGAASAIELGRYHVERLGLPGWDLAADSVWTSPGRRTATVRFTSQLDRMPGAPAVDVREAGVRNETQVEVAPTGAVHALTVDFFPDLPSETKSIQVISYVITGAVYLLFGGFLLVGFFRRLLVKAIDVKPALIDGFVFALFFVAMVVSTRGIVSGEGSIGMWVLAVAAVVFVAGTAAALVGFVLSGTSESIGRKGWPHKLLAGNLMRSGSVLNAHVGNSLVRGVGLGLVILGLLTAFMWVFGDAPIVFEGERLSGSFRFPVVAAFGLSGLWAYLESVVLVLTVASVFYSARRPGYVAVAIVAAVLAVARASMISFEDVWVMWLASGVVGLVAAYAFWKFDLLTVFVALSSASFLWYLLEAWIAPGSPLWLDFLLACLFLAFVLGVGLTGIVRGYHVPGAEDYVPSYIQELRSQERLNRELEIARQVQQSFLPSTMPLMSSLDIAARCVPAELVGGDYYDVVRLDEHRMVVVIGDVSGKGIQASFFMTLTKGFLRSLCREDLSPADVLRKMNRLFGESAPRGIFISIVYGIVDVSRGEFSFARAGHNPVIVRRANSEAEHLQPDGLAIGLDRGSEFDRVIQEQTVRLADGDTVVLYTDGLSEARNMLSEEFGDDRVVRTVSGIDATSAQQTLDDIFDEVSGFVEGANQHDDMTVLVVRVRR